MDALDAQIVQCLMLDGRASFRLIAQVVGSSEQTVARRYRRMHDDGVVRVIGSVPFTSTDDQGWLVRMRARPGAAETLAAELRDRQDVSWLALSSGGSEVVCLTVIPRNDPTATVLPDRLPREAAVLSFSASAILWPFVTPDSELVNLGSALSAEQTQRMLADAIDRYPDEAHRRPLEPEDLPLTDALARDGRASVTQLAHATGWPVSRVASRLEDILRGRTAFIDVDIVPAQFGLRTTAYLWLTVAPGALARLGRALAAQSEVTFAAAVTGTANLVISVAMRSEAELYRYVTERVGPLEGVSGVEIVPVLRRIKQQGTVLVDGRLRLSPAGESELSAPRAGR